MRQRACKPGSVLPPKRMTSAEAAAIRLALNLRAGSSDQPGRRAGTKLICRPYSVLHPVGFTVPVLLPGSRCALAAPFRPYPSEAGRCPFCGTIPDPGLRRGRRELPGTAVPWSPDFPRWSKLPRGRPALWLVRHSRFVGGFRVVLVTSVLVSVLGGRRPLATSPIISSE